MSSATTNLATVFEKACDARERVRDEPLRVLAELNGEIIQKNLKGRLVVLAIADEDLPPSFEGSRHSHLFPCGKLGGFAVRNCEDDTSELITIVHDVRGSHGVTQLPTVSDLQIPYDVNERQMNSDVLDMVKELLASRDFSFPELAKICEGVAHGNLGFALFTAALNDLCLPHHLASAIYTEASRAFYFHKGVDVGLYAKQPVRYNLSHFDMFCLMAPQPKHLPSLQITNMVPNMPKADFRNIFVDLDIVGYDRAI